jgi:hypothetical protein
VDGKIRALDQIDNCLQPSLVPYGERGINMQPELSESDNISEVETFECRVVRNIEKDGLNSPRSGHAISLRQNGMPSFGRISSVPRP